MIDMIKELDLDDLSTVTGGSMYSVDESIGGVQEFIEKCKAARSNNLSNDVALLREPTFLLKNKHHYPDHISVDQTRQFS